MICAAQIATALQTITSRNTHPLDSAVVSVTQIHGGDTWNVIPDRVVLRGTTRSFKPEVQDAIEAAIAPHRPRRRGGDGRARSSCSYDRRYPATVNSADRDGASPPTPRPPSSAPSMSSATCSRPWAPRISPSCCRPSPAATSSSATARRSKAPALHNPHYDFNDEILPIGASYWATPGRARAGAIALPVIANETRCVLRLRFAPLRMRRYRARVLILSGARDCARSRRTQVDST